MEHRTSTAQSVAPVSLLSIFPFATLANAQALQYHHPLEIRMTDILTQLQESMDLVINLPCHHKSQTLALAPLTILLPSQLCTMFIAGLYYNDTHHDLKTFNANDKVPDLKADTPKEGPLPFAFPASHANNSLANLPHLSQSNPSTRRLSKTAKPRSPATSSYRHSALST